MNTTQVIEVVKVHLRDQELVTPMLLRNKISDVVTAFKLPLSQQQKQDVLDNLIRFYSRWIPA